MKRSVRVFLASASGAGALLASQASFAQATWNFDVNSTANCTNKSSDSIASDINCSASVGTPQINKITDWFVNGSGVLNSVPNNDFDPASGVAVSGGEAGNDTGGQGGGGLGVKTAEEHNALNTPQHTYLDNLAVTKDDNSILSTEALLLNFATSVVLSKIIGSWPQTCPTSPNGFPCGSAETSQITVLRYVGTETDPNKFLKDRQMSTLTSNTSGVGKPSNQWEIVASGDLFSGGANGLNLGTNSSQGSSWWLISAYNSNYYGTPNAPTGFSNGNDLIRIFEIQGKRVAEPGSLALLAVALGGIFATRRRSRAAPRQIAA